MKSNSCNSRNRYARRRGQALLLAVLLMVFAAILGATFITIVSLNLSQTARGESKGESQNAAQAGLQFVDDQLVSQGLTWRPKSISPPPAPGDASYSFYYDEFDRAQGWRTNGVLPNAPGYESDGFVKFPDPRAESAGNSANFMTKVEKVKIGDSDNTDGSKTGALRVTVIGRATDNSAAFTRLVRYKAGARQNAVGVAMRTITNWDFLSGEVPHGEVASVDTNSVVLKNVRGTFPAKAAADIYNGYSVMIGDPISGIAPRAMAVAIWVPATKTLTFAETFAATGVTAPAVGERVEMAATLGAPNFINYDNSGGLLTAAGEAARFSVGGTTTDAANGTTAVGGIFSNGGLQCIGDVRAALVSAQSAPVGSKIQASSAVQIELPKNSRVDSDATDNPSAWLTNSSVSLNAQYNKAGTNQTVTGVALADNSAATNFPGNWTGTGGALNEEEKAQLVDDGWNRLAGNAGTTRSVVPIAAPTINPTHWRGLTRDSAPASGSDPTSASRWGYGEGIYIDNRDDRERVGTGDMTEAQFRQMLFDDSESTDTPAPPIWARSGTPALPATVGMSLEEKHLRGWVGPEEFRARGVLIEINNTDVTITRDSRSDDATSATTYYKGLTPQKAWRDENGELLGDDDLGGVYTQTFPWPENGVIFAEGNVRVRGVSTAPPRSLSIVSLGNIFIEGSTALQAASGPARKLLLMARKNVVLNPTQQIEQVDVQTRLAETATAGDTVITVMDANNFQVGDWIYLDTGATNEPSLRITAIDAAAGELTLHRGVPSTQLAVSGLVRSKSDPLFKDGTGSIVPHKYVRLERFDQVVQRRFQVGAAGEVRVAMKHSAERQPALRVRYKPPTLGATELPPVLANLGFKLAANNVTSIINRDEKVLTVHNGTSNLHSFGIPTPLTTGTTTANDYSLRWLGGDAGPTPAVRGKLREARNSPEWRYSDDADTDNVFPAWLLTPRVPPYFFLAAVGNRYKRDIVSDLKSKAIAPTFATVPANYREQLKGTTGWELNMDAPPTPVHKWYEIPMATSVAVRMNDQLASSAVGGLLGIRNDSTAGPEYVGQLGFNPLHGLETTGDNAPEDVLTVDQSFYTGSTTNSSNYSQTLDSRVLRNVGAGFNTVSLRFSETGPDGGPLENFFDATTTNAHIPYYRLHRLKFENLDTLNASNIYDKLAPAVEIDINAFVYAQNGSWLVVPGGFYDDDVANANTADYAEIRDLNRDGKITRAERLAAFRLLRYNYRINFSGAICENRTAPVFDSGSVKGLVSEWMNKWSTIEASTAQGNWVANTNDSLFQNIAFSNGNIGNINYSFDPALAAGQLDEDEAFQLPVEPGWLAEQ